MRRSEHSQESPGNVLLFGSGETAGDAQKAYRKVFETVCSAPQVAILETPAGFELNSEWVAEQVAVYIREHLRNFAPEVTLIPARKCGTGLSPDSLAIVAPLLTADVIYMGAGSPSYAVRQLQGSLAFQYLVARQRLGAGVIFASAAVVAAGRHALPVYEIYKVGEDLHWKGGLDFFGPYGLDLAFVPHWNNSDGGAHLDTSRCFMGRSRFDLLCDMLPDSTTVVGIDERTGLLIDLQQRHCQVMGNGSITVVANGRGIQFDANQGFPLAALGPFRALACPACDIPAEVWDRVRAAVALPLEPPGRSEPLPAVLALIRSRQAARARRDWTTADALRDQVLALGWRICDTPDGPQLVPLAKPGSRHTAAE